MYRVRVHVSRAGAAAQHGQRSRLQLLVRGPVDKMAVRAEQRRNHPSENSISLYKAVSFSPSTFFAAEACVPIHEYLRSRDLARFWFSSLARIPRTQIKQDDDSSPVRPSSVCQLRVIKLVRENPSL
jgi:hypothetical protein